MDNPYITWTADRLEFELRRLRFLNRTYAEKHDKDEAVKRLRLIYDALMSKHNPAS